MVKVEVNDNAMDVVFVVLVLLRSYGIAVKVEQKQQYNYFLIFFFHRCCL